jgi:hypothetical protein
VDRLKQNPRRWGRRGYLYSPREEAQINENYNTVTEICKATPKIRARLFRPLPAAGRQFGGGLSGGGNMKFTPDQLDFMIHILETGGGMIVFLAIAIKTMIERSKRQ